MLRPKNGRKYTVSVALPASVIDNAQNFEMKATLVGQIARALTIYSVDEVILYEDRADAPKDAESAETSKGLAFFARNLQYLETPQYLRRQLLPVHRDLKWVGLLSPLDAPHHLRKTERLPYREGAVLSLDNDLCKGMVPPGGKGTVGCWVNCGMDWPVWIDGTEIPSETRVTVRLVGKAAGRTKDTEENADVSDDNYRGIAVDSSEPRTKLGLYWGYQMRIAGSLKAVFDECPFEEGYDLSIGTSERGESLGVSRVPKFKHLLVTFGGLGGLEEAVSDRGSGYDQGVNPSSLFSRYIDICPGQTSRTIRTEEALLITLASLSPHLPER